MRLLINRLLLALSILANIGAQQATAVRGARLRIVALVNALIVPSRPHLVQKGNKEDNDCCGLETSVTDFLNSITQLLNSCRTGADWVLY